MTTSKPNENAKMLSTDAQAAVEGAGGAEGTPGAGGKKKAYSPPTVKALGNVAELTFGGTSGMSDMGTPSKIHASGH